MQSFSKQSEPRQIGILPQIGWPWSVVLRHVDSSVSQDHEEQRNLGSSIVGVTHSPQCLVELSEPFLDGRSVQKPVSWHREVEVAVHQTLSILFWKHHAEIWVIVRVPEGCIAECKDASWPRKGYGFMHTLLYPE